MPSLLLSSNYTRSDLTLSGAVDEVLADIAMTNNQNFISTGNVVTWLNRAQTIIARDCCPFHITVVSGVTSGTAEYPLSTDTVGKCLAVEYVLHNGKPLGYRTTDWLYANNWLWRTAAAGTPLYYYQLGMSAIGLYPAPDTTDTDALTLVITALPPKLTDPEDNFYVPQGCEDVLISYAKYQASLKDAYGEGAHRIEIYKQEWEQGKSRAEKLTAGVAIQETLQMGGDAELLKYGSLYGWPINPETVATSL